MVRPIRTRSCEDACIKITWGVRAFCILPTNERFRLDSRLVAVSLLILVILLANRAYWLMSGLITHEGFYHHILYSSRMVMETLTIIVIVVEFIVKRDRFRSVVYNLKTVESALAEVGQRWSWSIHPGQYLRFPLLTVLLVLLPILYSELYYWPVMHIEILFIGIYVSHVCAFYDMLKYSLAQIRTSEVCTLHTKLYSMIESSSEDLNALNGNGIFLMLASYFQNVLHQIYQVFNVDNIPWERYNEMFWSATYYSSFIVWVIITCNGISSEAKKFNTNLYNKVTQNNTVNLDYDCITFHFDIKKSGLQFDANGFFSVNNSLICSMIIAATTYLVLLLQLSPRVPAWVIA
ncbi:Gustatory receptor 128 [Halyomorpha halys]|nr:Gustatory receptor 128 [Halyomorpha halys]